MACKNPEPERATVAEGADPDETIAPPVSVEPPDTPEGPPADGVDEPDSPPGVGDEYPDVPHDV